MSKDHAVLSSIRNPSCNTRRVQILMTTTCYGSWRTPSTTGGLYVCTFTTVIPIPRYMNKRSTSESISPRENRPESTANRSPVNHQIDLSLLWWETSPDGISSQRGEVVSADNKGLLVVVQTQEKTVTLPKCWHSNPAYSLHTPVRK